MSEWVSEGGREGEKEREGGKKLICAQSLVHIL